MNPSFLESGQPSSGFVISRQLQIERLTLNRTFDCNSIDSDASDLHILGSKGHVETYAYNDDLEGFIAAASVLKFTRQHGNMCMQLAIYGGARRRQPRDCE